MASIVTSPTRVITSLTGHTNAGDILTLADGQAVFGPNLGVVTPEQYGAVGNGVTDDSAAIQAAINSGKIIQFKAQTTYAIATTLTIGTGTSASVSSQNGVVLSGTTSGAAASEFAPSIKPTCLKWIGGSGGTMVSVNGPMVGCTITGLALDCAGIASTGIRTQHMVSSTWRDVVVTRYTGFAIIHEAYAAFSGMAQGANKNTFINCRAKNPGAGGSGMRVGVTSGYVAGMLDVAQNVWINCEWYRDGTSAPSTSLYLAFCDNLTFIECATWSQGGTSGVGVYVNPPSGAAGNTRFPQEVLFLNCPSLSGFTVDASWSPVAGIVCYPYPTSDGEPIPNSPFIVGMDYTGRYFGHYFLALAASAAPVNNGDLAIQKTSDTSLTFKVKGGDGVIRSGSLTLA